MKKLFFTLLCLFLIFTFVSCTKDMKSLKNQKDSVNLNGQIESFYWEYEMRVRLSVQGKEITCQRYIIKESSEKNEVMFPSELFPDRIPRKLLITSQGTKLINLVTNNEEECPEDIKKFQLTKPSIGDQINEIYRQGFSISSEDKQKASFTKKDAEMEVEVLYDKKNKVIENINVFYKGEALSKQKIIYENVKGINLPKKVTTVQKMSTEKLSSSCRERVPEVLSEIEFETKIFEVSIKEG